MAVFAGQNRDQLRRMYLDTWRKFTARAALEPLEAQVAAVIAEHPEYVQWLEAGEAALAAEFTPESGRQNPFLHMGLHLAIREQVATNRRFGMLLRLCSAGSLQSWRRRVAPVWRRWCRQSPGRIDPVLP